MSRRTNPSTARHTETVWFLSGQTTNQETVRHIPVHTFPFRIGRRSDVGLQLDYPTISGLHAEFLEQEEQLLLRDLNSTNGTFVNGNQIHGTIVLQQNDLVQFADIPFRVRRQTSAGHGLTVATKVCDYALALVQFDKLMSNRAVIPYYQPIINLRDGRTIGYEILGRSDVYGLETPDAMFQAASQLDLQVELSRMFRWEGVRQVADVKDPPHVFVNTHPLELQDPGFIASLKDLRTVSPRQSITLEIHESSVTDVEAMRRLRTALDDLGMKLAYDDFGSGQDRLVQLFDVRPDYLKFDMDLIRDIDKASPSRQKMLETLVRMVADLEIAPLAEGVETAGEDVLCHQLGFELAQGFYYGKPAPSRLGEAAHSAPTG